MFNTKLGPLVEAHNTTSASSEAKDLIAGCRYTLQVHIDGATIPVPNSTPFSFLVPLPTPQNLQWEHSSTGELCVSFDEVWGAASYKVTAHGDNGTSLEHVTTEPHIELVDDIEGSNIKKIEVVALGDDALSSFLPATAAVEGPTTKEAPSASPSSPPRPSKHPTPSSLLPPPLRRPTKRVNSRFHDESDVAWHPLRSADDTDTETSDGESSDGSRDESWDETDEDSDWSDHEAPPSRKQEV